MAAGAGVRMSPPVRSIRFPASILADPIRPSSDVRAVLLFSERRAVYNKLVHHRGRCPRAAGKFIPRRAAVRV
eukprot:1021742-Pyramimonas_sp.AAC.1